MEWFIDNKEWLFSGVAIAVPIAIIGLFANRQRVKMKQKSGSNSTNYQSAGDIVINNNNDRECKDENESKG